MKKYLWFIPALYVAYEFCGKLFEVLSDKQEFADIISAIKPLAPFANYLAYGIGFFDFFIGLALLTFSFFPQTKKYHQYVFIWTIFWPFVPSSVRYFSGVAPFEITQVLLMSGSAILAYFLWSTYARK